MSGYETQNQREEPEQRFQELKQESQEWKILIGKQEERLQNLQGTGFQIANYYFIFQGVIVVAISNSSSSFTCHNRWFLFTLSLLAAVLNLYGLITIGVKYIRRNDEHDRSWSIYNQVARELYQIRRTGPTHGSTDVKDRRGKYQIQSFLDSEDPPWRDHYAEIKRRFYLASCMVLFLGFAGVTLSVCWRIPCPDDEDKGNCIKLCDGAKCMTLCNDM